MANNGLFDFMNTPAGIGLLSAVASGFANARRGTPFNNIGRGVAGGLMGYSSAKDAIAQEQENAFNKQFKQFQMDKMKREMEREQATQAWQAGLPEALKKTKEVKTPFQADDAFNEGIGNGLFNAEQVPDMQARQDYLMRPESPYAGKLIEQQLFPKGPEYKVVGDSLVAIGDEGAKPVYTANKQPKVSQDMTDWLMANGIDPASATPEQLNTAYGATNQQKDRRASLSAPKVVADGGARQFGYEQDLRKEFTALPETKAFVEVQGAFDQINAALKNPSGANDLTVATKFMKLLDPGSVVRESELAMAMQTSGAWDRFSNYAENVMSGKKLTPTQREDFRKAANELYAAARGRYQAKADDYRGQAERWGLAPDAIAPGAWKTYGYKNKPDAVKDAKNTILRNPGAKAEVIRRLEEMGITDHGIK